VRNLGYEHPGTNSGLSANGLAAAARPKLLKEQRGQWKLFRVTDPFVVVNAQQAPQVVSKRSSS
jgi:hypothetical protein